MVNCDLFELKSVVEGGEIKIYVLTDLPSGTRVILDVHRGYLDEDSVDSIWAMFNDSFITTPINDEKSGFEIFLNVAVMDQEAEGRFKARLSEFSKKTLPVVSDEIRISCVVGARQPLKSFGKKNANLTGRHVEERGGVKVIRKENKEYFKKAKK